MTRSSPEPEVAVIALTGGGVRLGGEIAAALGEGAQLHVLAKLLPTAPAGAVSIAGSLAGHVTALFGEVDALVFVMATGIAIRTVAPLLGSKQADPAVLAVDEAGQHVVPLLGGHQADANALATRLADAIGGRAVITTASDSLGLPALDTLGRAAGWRVEASSDTLKAASAAIVDGQTAAIVQECGETDPIRDLPPEWPRLASFEELHGHSGPRLLVTDRVLDPGLAAGGGPLVVYRPPTLILGVGCSLGAPANEIEALARTVLTEAGLSAASVGVVATIDRRLTEPGIGGLAATLGAQLVAYSAAALSTVAAPTPSSEVARHVGTPGVCEPAALLASQGGTLLVAKQKSPHATVAVARQAPAPPRAGKLWLVGLGPGALDLMTQRARRALRESEVVIGYRGYLEMLESLVAPRRLRPYELGQEQERAEAAIALARGGADVALVSSGDIGIYAMAGLIFEILEAQSMDTPLDVEVIPGITAAGAAASLLGAPLMLDFAAISLSDLLVPWDSIGRRLIAAAEGDLVVVLYNPASIRRRAPLEEALSILREHRAPETPVGLVREAYRPGQEVTITTLAKLPTERVDMRTVVIVGCSRTDLVDGRMVTRRGYLTRDQAARNV